MDYCSLEDAWGKVDYISDQYKKYESKDDIIENFNQTTMINDEVNYAINDNRIPEKIISNKIINNNNNKCVFTCDDFISHLNKCSTCRMRIRKQFSSKIVNKIQHIIFDNKDTVLLILMALFILIFFNLLFSIFRH
jgi:nitrous oxide reductase